MYNQNFSGNATELTKVLGADETKSFTLTIHWNLANLVKIYHGIIELRHFIDPRQMASLKEPYEEKEGFSAVLPQSGLDERWWADSMECYCDLRNIQDLLSDGKTLHERRSRLERW